MPVSHLEIRIVQRSKGSSAVAGAAYQAGEKLFSEYDQKSKDHRRKQPEVLYAEYSKLQATYAELAGQLAAAKEELQPVKDIRYWVSKVLTPEQSEVEKKPEPKHSITEKMKFLQEQSSNQQEQKTPQQKKQNMEL